MATIPLFTFKDLIDHLVDYVGDNATKQAVRDAKRAALDAYRDLASYHDWSYYTSHLRIITQRPQTDGTIQYLHSSGAYPRQLILTGATWPSWSALGQVVINAVPCKVAARINGTNLQLDIGSNPGADVAAGAVYNLNQGTYQLPCDFIGAVQFYNMQSGVPLTYEAPGAWLARQRVYQGPSAPYTYSYVSDPNSFGALALALFPIPDNAYPLDSIYKRRARPLIFDQYNAGTASVANVMGGTTTVTGSGTAWTSAMVGSVIRLSSNSTDYPTGLSGANRAAEENVIVSVESTTSLTVDAAIVPTYSGVKYVISDPVDVEDGAMLTVLLRGCESQSTFCRIMKNQETAQQAFTAALIRAKESDRRHLGRRLPGAAPTTIRLRDYPAGSDIG